MTAKGLFITGTNTEVGKTIISRAIIRALVRRDFAVAAVKPVESGAERRGQELIPLDATALKAAANTSAALHEICFYRFEDPVSPHLAAANAGRKIEEQIILDQLADRTRKADVVVAEGAGGLMVPLSEDLLYADLIARTEFRLVIVAPNVLGTINATLLTIEAARARQIDVAGVILNRTPPAQFDNAAAIANHGRVPILGEFPDAPDATTDTLADIAERTIALDALIS